MSETPVTDPAPRRRWLMPLLLASLALNLLIVGIVVGALVSPGGPRDRDEASRTLRGVVGEPFYRALPEGERRSMMREALGNREAFRESREALRARLEAFLAALRAEEFDRAEAERLLGAQREAANRRQDLGERLLLDRLEAMDREARVAYAEALEERFRSFRRR